MIDLDAELIAILDTLEQAAIDQALTGSLADALHRGSGVHSSIDLLVDREDLDGAAAAFGALGYHRASPELPCKAGTYRLRRLLKTQDADAAHLNLIAPASPVLAALLAEPSILEWRGRPIPVTGGAAIRALEASHSVLSSKLQALWNLRLTLPDHPTWAERDLIPRFDTLSAAPASAQPTDIEAVLVGWRRWCWLWRTSDLATMADRLPSGLVERDPALSAYRDAARTATAVRRAIRCIFHSTVAGLTWAE